MTNPHDGPAPPVDSKPAAPREEVVSISMYLPQGFHAVVEAKEEQVMGQAFTLVRFRCRGGQRHIVSALLERMARQLRGAE